MDEKEKETIIDFESFRTAENDKTKLVLPMYDKNERWVQEYMEQFGIAPSFF